MNCASFFRFLLLFFRPSPMEEELKHRREELWLLTHTP